MSAEMRGPWQKLKVDLAGLPGKQREIKKFLLDTSAVEFQRGIQSKIISNNVAPQSKEVSAQEYAGKIVIERSPSTSVIGLPKANTLSVDSFKLGEWAIGAEYGLYGNKYMGIWRNYISEFEKRVEEIVARMQRTK